MRKPSFPAGLLFLLCFTLTLGAQDAEAALPPGPSDPFLKEREALAAEIAAVVSSLPQPVREAISLIPRHLFAPDNHRSFAYQNRSLPLGSGKILPAPGDIAKIAALLNPGQEDRVLVLGSSAGYGAVLFSFLAREVVLMEEVGTERERMRSLLEDDGRTENRRNLILMPDWTPEALSDQGPFDIVFIHGGVTEIPRTVLALTKPEARIAALLKEESGSSLLIIIERNGSREGITVHGDMFFPTISAWSSEGR